MAQPITGADVYAANRRRYDMATRNAAAGIGGRPGTNPIGDRPGTTTLADQGRAWDSAAGRAHLFAVGAFLAVVFLHMAAESRFRE